MLSALEAVSVRPEQLAELTAADGLFQVALSRAERYARTGGGHFDAAEWEEHPDRYQSVLAPLLPHLTVLVHGAFWLPEQARLVTRADLRALWSGPEPPRLRVIADISCDVQGAIEATVRATTLDDPVYVFDVDTGEVRSGVEGKGPVILAVDNLPCEFPAESSRHFGQVLRSLVPALHNCDWDARLEDLELPAEIRRAIITHRGSLAPSFTHLEQQLPVQGRAPVTCRRNRRPRSSITAARAMPPSPNSCEVETRSPK